jgi:hypothetical protein
MPEHRKRKPPRNLDQRYQSPAVAAARLREWADHVEQHANEGDCVAWELTLKFWVPKFERATSVRVISKVGTSVRPVGSAH